MVDDAADGECGQPAAAERAEFPRRHPAAAVLRSRGGAGGQLWRDRFGNRPRDQPQLRRQGSQFDADGKLINWWTPEDFARFNAAGAKLVAQYNQYEAVPGVHVNGQLTLSENIAAAAGLSAAYDAYRSAAAARPPARSDALTADQQFFV